MSVDVSIRFATNDSIRDRMVLSLLRNVVASLSEGKAKEAARAELKDALKNSSTVSKEI
jgi:flagellar basal body-associated protein FliL